MPSGKKTKYWSLWMAMFCSRWQFLCSRGKLLGNNEDLSQGKPQDTYTWKAEFLSSGWATEYKRNKQECPDHSYCTDNSSQKAPVLEGAGVILSTAAYPGKDIGENRHKESLVLLTFSFYSTLNPSLWGCFISFLHDMLIPHNSFNSKHPPLCCHGTLHL